MPDGDEGVRDPEELEATGAPAQGEIAAATTLGAVHLTVADLDRSIAYYGSDVGLEALRREGGTAVLGVGGRELLVLAEEPGARPSDGFTGLYHFALLVPERADLARWLIHAAQDQVPMTGLSDHFVSEALYLRDPDGHGIEIYWDRPREVWEGRVAERMTSLPLDTDDLVATVADEDPAPFERLADGTIMGHVHLKVSEIESTTRFYRDVLGFALMAALGPMAAFLSAGGYHHHLGANTWESAGAEAAPPGSAALRHFTVVLPDQGELDRVLGRLEEAGVPATETESGPLVRDPSGNGLVLTL